MKEGKEIITQEEFTGEWVSSNCMVCRSRLKDEDDLVSCPHCKNLAHREHLLEWLHMNNTCPYCKTSLKEQDIVDITRLNELASKKKLDSLTDVLGEVSFQMKSRLSKDEEITNPLEELEEGIKKIEQEARERKKEHKEGIKKIEEEARERQKAVKEGAEKIKKSFKGRIKELVSKRFIPPEEQILAKQFRDMHERALKRAEKTWDEKLTAYILKIENNEPDADINSAKTEYEDTEREIVKIERKVLAEDKERESKIILEELIRLYKKANRLRDVYKTKIVDVTAKLGDTDATPADIEKAKDEYEKVGKFLENFKEEIKRKERCALRKFPKKFKKLLKRR